MSKFLLLFLILSSIFVLGFGCQKKDVIKTENLNQETSINLNVPKEESATLPEEEEETSIPWQEVEGGHYLSVPYYYQKEVPEYGGYACGPASLKMVLEYKKEIGETEKSVPPIYEIINEIGVKDSLWQDSNVDNYFITNFGITDVALKKLALQLGYNDTLIFGQSFYPDYPISLAIDPAHKNQPIDSKDWRAQIDEENWDIEKLYETVENGQPVIVDVTLNLEPLSGSESSRSYNPFYTGDGKKHWELLLGKGHYMVVIGFKNWGKEGAAVILLDPLKKTEDENNISTYSLDKFEKSWVLLNNQGILIK